MEEGGDGVFDELCRSRGSWERKRGQRVDWLGLFKTVVRFLLLRLVVG